MYKQHLATDPVMASLIEKHGELDLNYESSPFDDLVYSIISQQLSDKAASTIAARFVKLAGETPFNPFKVQGIPDVEMREAGISFAKIKYIKEIAQAVSEGRLNFQAMEKMEDEQVIFELTKIKGIGKWTAEMFLIFTLKREDVFSLGDAGLRRAVSNLYYANPNDLEAIEKISLKWKPYRSYASRYLWKSLG
jgi:DNA-3-methyladenine glycosylase II